MAFPRSHGWVPVYELQAPGPVQNFMGGQDWVLELCRSWLMLCSIEWYAPGQCTVLHWLSGYDCRAGGI